MQTKIVLSASVLVFAAQLVSAGPIKIRGSTTVLLKKRGCKGSTTVTNIQDNDGIDAKGLTLDLGLLKRGSTTVSNIQDNDLLADAKGAAVDVSLLKKRCKSTVDVTNIQDNDGIDAK
ncbi:unnamed protein product, partial [Tilletia controversa]